MTAVALRSVFAVGDTVYRHALPIFERIDPLVAAASLRGDDRIMMTYERRRPDSPIVFAFGDLAVCSRALSGQRDDGADLLTTAVDFLAALNFGVAASPDERCWFGFIGYDAVRDFERLSSRADGSLPVYQIFLPEVLIRIGTVSTIVVGRGVTPTAAQQAASRARKALLRKSGTTFRPTRTGTGRFSPEFADYVAAVRKAKEYIANGDIFQVVLSISCTASATADGLALYAKLAALNPSPFQFWYRGPEFEAVGASPEPCVVLKNGHVLIRPLAGTRPRGADREVDRVAELDLQSSDKELAEHRMLVDLARNDVGRVCQPGSVHVPRLMVVEYYSHVIHLASDVIGRLRPDYRADNVIRATFPAGTMTGAPKVRAMEIIDELEPTGRGLYAGAVGTFGVDRVNLYLTIRSIILYQGQVRMQAGGGIVYDSDPVAEYKECIAKLQAAARVIGIDMERVAP